MPKLRDWRLFAVFVLITGSFVYWLYLTEPHKCAPFAQKEVPDEKDGNWELVNTSIDVLSSDASVIVLNEYYEHKTQKDLKLGVHSYFGEVGFKSWACDNSKIPAGSSDSQDREDHIVAILKDKHWYFVYAQAPKIAYEYETNANGKGQIKRVVLALVDKNGKVVVERTITRPE